MFRDQKRLIAAVAVAFLLNAEIFAQKKINIEKDFAEVMKLIDENFYGDLEIDKDKIKKEVFKSLMKSLGDDYSGYFSEGDLKSFQANMDGKYAGLGLTIEKKENQSPVIVSIIEEGPADKAGIKIGESLEEIDGIPIKELSTDEVLRKLRGDVNTSVKLSILSEETKSIKEVILKREIINKKYVAGQLLENDIGYIKISQFGNQISEEVEQIIKKMQKEGMKSLVLDLRDNPGGSLIEAVKTTSLFISKGKIVSTKGKKGKEYVYNREGEYLGNFPLAVLINENSASACEILAGAIRDYKRGILVGKKSYGKGSVQQTVPLKNGGAIKLTVAKYFTPGGEMIHGKGLEPHFKVEEEEMQLEQARAVLLNMRNRS